MRAAQARGVAALVQATRKNSTTGQTKLRSLRLVAPFITASRLYFSEMASAGGAEATQQVIYTWPEPREGSTALTDFPDESSTGTIRMNENGRVR